MTKKYTNNELVAHLSYYNEWRRQDYDNPAERLEQPKPKELGIVIDQAADRLRRMDDFEFENQFLLKEVKRQRYMLCIIIMWIIGFIIIINNLP